MMVGNRLSDMKVDLIIHIGFPKCASTTLQNYIFRNESGYLGTHKGLSKREDYAKKFKGFTPAGPRLRGNLDQANHWKQEVLQVTAEKWPDSKRLILSNEPLVNRNKLQDRPIIGFLKEFSEQIWQEGAVKVILILRNPAERMASAYAQVSGGNPHASQKDFEKHVNRQLRKNNKTQYDKWVEELHSALGRENVCVLLMEEIKEVSFWRRLNDFCQLEQFDPEEWVGQSRATNTRKIDEQSWTLRPFDPASKANTSGNNLFNLLWPPYLLSQVRNSCLESYKFLLSQYYKARYGKGGTERPNQITLVPSLKEKIQRAYTPQTQGLSALLGKDLKDLGY